MLLVWGLCFCAFVMSSLAVVFIMFWLRVLVLSSFSWASIVAYFRAILLRILVHQSLPENPILDLVLSSSPGRGISFPI